ncbi:type II-A CRISPR-associated protein Csn2 [Butyricicoccus faecihominis]|nr:type II-A CRISPR-associated protein Csn2 [Butyricicoccus faecihominis]MBT9818523.1 type II-A CRISPR-associated protein Csn2 [Butyricicoccus faecihominis]
MMTLTYPLLSAPISFAENEIPVLIIENPMELRNFLYDLKCQISGQEGMSVLSENFEPIEIANSLILLTDILSVDFTTRKLINRIYEEIALAAANHADTLRNSMIALNQIALQIATEMEFDVNFVELTDPTPILKQFNFSVDVSNLSCVERLTLYIKLQQRFLKKKLVAVYNLKACLSSDELNLFYQTILYEKLHILLIEDIQRRHPLSIEHTFIIDRDLCIF